MKRINYSSILAWMLLSLLPFVLHAQVQTSSGLRLVASGPVKLVFHDADLVHHGQLTADASTFLFTGNASPAFIGGSQPVFLHNLVIDKNGRDLVLNNNLHISGTVTLNNGNLELNGRELELGYTGNIIGERNASHITGRQGGTIKVIAQLNAPRAANPGNIGVEITSNARLGETVISRGHSAGLTAEGRQVINRCYDIKPQFNDNLRASIKFYYLDAELNSDEGALTIFSANTNQSQWHEAGKDMGDTGNNWIIKNGLDQLHRYTLAGTTHKAIAQPPGKTAAQLFPNPTSDRFTILLNTAEETAAVINLYDQLGRLLESKRMNCRAGVNTIVWDIEKYAAGSYYLSFQNLDLKMVKIVKQ